jgi:hypothetical protein
MQREEHKVQIHNNDRRLAILLQCDRHHDVVVFVFAVDDVVDFNVLLFFLLLLLLFEVSCLRLIFASIRHYAAICAIAAAVVACI